MNKGRIMDPAPTHGTRWNFGTDAMDGKHELNIAWAWAWALRKACQDWYTEVEMITPYRYRFTFYFLEREEEVVIARGYFNMKL